MTTTQIVYTIWIRFTPEMGSHLRPSPGSANRAAKKADGAGRRMAQGVSRPSERRGASRDHRFADVLRRQLSHHGASIDQRGVPAPR